MRLSLIILSLLVFSSSLWCQDAPRAEMFGGYSYVSYDAADVTNRLNLNGWEASATINFNRWAGLEADFSGHYKGDCGGMADLTCKDLSFMVGPRFTYRKNRVTAFTHGLFGGDNGSVGMYGLSASDTKLALAAGGGFDYAVTKSISIRLLQVDYFMVRHAADLGADRQHNIRASAGIVFTFGKLGGRGAHPSSPTASEPTIPNTGEAALLGVVGYPTDKGLRITSVIAGSPAERIFLKSGDVISEIDGKGIRSAHDVESAIAASATGTIRVTCLIQTAALGALESKKEVKVR